MKKILISLLILIFLFGCIDSIESNDKINVIVSILPQKEVVEFIGGNQVNVIVLIPPGASPATYSPSAQDLIAIEKADIYFKIGLLPFEKNNEKKILELNPELKIINLSQEINLRKFTSTEHHTHSHELEHNEHNHHEHEHNEHNHHEHNHNHSHSESNFDPHLWLSPLNMISFSNQVSFALTELKPDFSDFFIENKNQYVSKLNSLHLNLIEIFSNLNQKNLLVFHPAWGYFADEYGLIQIAIEQDGNDPTTQQLKELIDFAKKENIKVVFVQKQFSSTAAQTIASELNGTVISINPLAENYLENMQLIGKKIARELN